MLPLLLEHRLQVAIGDTHIRIIDEVLMIVRQIMPDIDDHRLRRRRFCVESAFGSTMCSAFSLVKIFAVTMKIISNTRQTSVKGVMLMPEIG